MSKKTNTHWRSRRVAQLPGSEFKKIEFGYASAQAEARKNPKLLINGFLDVDGFTEKVHRGHEWLILGYKGSGKSAIAERLRLLHESDAQAFVNLVNLEDFEYARLSHLAGNKEALETALPTAWSWVIYSFLLNSFFQDNA